MENVPKINYQKKLDEIIAGLDPEKAPPKLLLHSCCAPCSSYVIEYLSQYFEITVFYYNPNIYPEDEYFKRVDEQTRFINSIPTHHPVTLIVGEYKPEDFYSAVKGLEQLPEGSERCFACYRLRLEAAARAAESVGAEWFTTTLSISPYKNAAKLNEISTELSNIYNVKSLPADFKKRGGYKRSVELSAEYGLYRQDYCGCVFSNAEREGRKN
jgi:hypothetical protein